MNDNNEVEQIKSNYENKLTELTQEISNYKNEINKLRTTINQLKEDIQNKNETISQLLKHNEMNSIKLTNLETQINDFINNERNNTQMNSIQSNNNNNTNQSNTINDSTPLKNLSYIDNIISNLNESLNQIIPPLNSKVPYYKLDNLKSLNLPSSSHQRSLTEGSVALKEKKNVNFPQCVVDNSKSVNFFNECRTTMHYQDYSRLIKLIKAANNYEISKNDTYLKFKSILEVKYPRLFDLFIQIFPPYYKQ